MGLISKQKRGQAAIESNRGSASSTARCLMHVVPAKCTSTAGTLRKGQAATEVLVLAGFALMFILPIAMLFLSVSNSTLGKSSILQAKTAARTIADEAGEVYLQGAGARKMIIVNYPEGIKGASIDGNLVIFHVDADNRQLDIISSSFANITGNLSGKRTAGLQRISLVNENGNYVNITYDK